MTDTPDRRGFFGLLAGALAAPLLPAPTPVPRPIAFGVDMATGPDRYVISYWTKTPDEAWRYVRRAVSDRNITINEDVRLAA